MTHLYIDPCGGCAGDMLLGALVDAGADAEALAGALATLPVAGYTLETGRVRRGALDAVRLEVRLDPATEQPHRHLRHIVEILDGAALPGEAAARAKAVFGRLAAAEATVHGTTPEKVHFHEVGAVDSIVDIVGVCVALELLGVRHVTAGPTLTGSGLVAMAHGRLPVPAPATLELLKGVPTRPSEEQGERTTPTGAALLATLAEAFGPLPPMTVRAVGYGAGAREGGAVPNVTRVVLGDAAAPDAGAHAGGEAAVLIETNLDDTTGELLAAAAEAMREAGALDVWLVPIQMKKGRPGVLVSALAAPDRAAAVEAALFAATPTFGVRRTRVERTCLGRSHETVETPYGPVRVKVGVRPSGPAVRQPEYEDCRRAAEAAGAAVRDVYEAARVAAARAAAEEDA